MRLLHDIKHFHHCRSMYVITGTWREEKNEMKREKKHIMHRPFKFSKCHTMISVERAKGKPNSVKESTHKMFKRKKKISHFMC